MDEPEEVRGAGLFYDAYRDLITCRSGDGGPIPWDKAVAYAERKGLAPDTADILWTVIRKMDQAERQWQVDSVKAEAGDG